MFLHKHAVKCALACKQKKNTKRALSSCGNFRDRLLPLATVSTEGDLAFYHNDRQNTKAGCIEEPISQRLMTYHILPTPTHLLQLFMWILGTTKHNSSIQYNQHKARFSIIS
jgi:hypothetical protein